MPAEHVEELQRLHRMYQRGEFDIDTVKTNHRLIVGYQRRRTVGGYLGATYQSEAPTYDEMEPSVAELDEPVGTLPPAPREADQHGDTSGCSSVYHEINANGAATAGRFGALVRGGFSAEMVRGRPRDPEYASRLLAAMLRSSADSARSAAENEAAEAPVARTGHVETAQRPCLATSRINTAADDMPEREPCDIDASRTAARAARGVREAANEEWREFYSQSWALRKQEFGGMPSFLRGLTAAGTASPSFLIPFLTRSAPPCRVS